MTPGRSQVAWPSFDLGHAESVLRRISEEEEHLDEADLTCIMAYLIDGTVRKTTHTIDLAEFVLILAGQEAGKSEASDWLVLGCLLYCMHELIMIDDIYGFDWSVSLSTLVAHATTVMNLDIKKFCYAALFDISKSINSYQECIMLRTSIVLVSHAITLAEFEIVRNYCKKSFGDDHGSIDMLKEILRSRSYFENERYVQDVMESGSRVSEIAFLAVVEKLDDTSLGL